MSKPKLPFRAALFDLDGTLLDSMDVWTKIDARFFASRGLAVPEDYGREVAGKSYRETAEYTVERYLPGERWENLIEEWTKLSREEYALRVPLKPGALDYLRMLKRCGVMLAVTTALPEELFRPCLARLGVLELFDALCSTDHTDGRGKQNGEVFRLAARRLGVAPSECAVFEDVPAGLIGARNAGMRAYAVLDDHSRAEWTSMRTIADGAVRSFAEMRAIHPFDDDPRCVIFSGYCENDPNRVYIPEDGDFVLCADAGWEFARRCGVMPALVIGDFDSAAQPDDLPCQVHPVMKDDSDTMLCLREGLKRGYDRFLIVGGLGGRFDHTLSNIQSMAWAASQGCSVRMEDENTRVEAVHNGRLTFKNGRGKLSVFSLTDRSNGVNIRGMLYPVEDGTLTNTWPIGLSNEFVEAEASIEVRDGTLLVIQSRLP